ncbi:hypothetical protein AB0J30_14920 [Streptomyces microflavus]|uniref:hypothetical protein n=1 Tax=Streptomyces microflavus TaxID=1919 RepID=UPI00341D6627
MPMTLKVYEVSRDGTIRTIRPEAEVKPLEKPEASHQFPACQCPECPETAR